MSPRWRIYFVYATVSVVNTSTDSVGQSITVEDFPNSLFEENGKLFYVIDNQVYTSSLNLTSLPSNPLFSTSGQGIFGIYGFAVENGKIYVADAVDFSSAGKAYVYNSSGELETSFDAVQLPNGFYLND